MALSITNKAAATSNWTTGSFTPSNNSLLVVMATNLTPFLGNTATWSCSGGGLTWTKRVDYVAPDSGSGLCTTVVIFTAPVTTGASMSVSVGCSEGSIDGAATNSVSVTEVTGYDTGSPIGLSASQGHGQLTGHSGNESLSLGGTTASSSAVFSVLMADGDNEPQIINSWPSESPTEFIAVADGSPAWARKTHAYITGARTTAEWEAWTSSYGHAVGAIEIKAAGGGTTVTRTATIAGVGSVVGVRKAKVKRSATIAGAGAVSGAHKSKVRRTTSIAAAATVAAVAVKRVTRTATITGQAAVTAQAKAKTRHTATITGQAAVSPVAKAKTRHTASIAGQATASPQAKAKVKRSATIAAAATVSPVGLVATPTAANIQGTGFMLGQAKSTAKRTAAIAGTGSLTATRKVTVKRTASISAGATVSGIASTSAVRTTTIAGAATVSAVGKSKARHTTSVSAGATVNAVGKAVNKRTANIQASAAVSASRKATVTRTATIQGRTTVTAYKGIEPGAGGGNVNPIPNLPIGFPITGA